MSKHKVAEILLGVLLVVAIISVIRMLFKLDKAADTKLYDSDALDQLKDKDSREKIDKYVEEYYKSGKWDEKLLKES